jgi:hypothetical protein
MSEVACTRCHCEDVRRMRRQGILEGCVLAKISLYPSLRGRCGDRFFASVLTRRAPIDISLTD